MVITHLVFWTKRIALLMLIIFSPYYEAIYSVISGFIVFTSFTCLDLEYRATTNKLEVLYHVFIYSPPVIVCFINMLMEGHYISYDSKYITCCFTIGICMVIYLLVIPLRMYDYYKYQKIQKLKRIEHFRKEKYGATTNQSIFAYTNDKDLSVSKYTNDDNMKSKFEDDMNQSKISNFTSSNIPVPKIESEDFMENEKNEDDKSMMKWRKKKITIVPNSDAQIDLGMGAYTVQKPANNLEGETELKNLEEEKKLPGPIRFIGKSNIPDFSQPKQKKFNLPNF